VRVAVLALALCACGHKPLAGESVAEVCRVENNEKELSVSGHLVAPIVAIPCEKTCAIVLAAKSGEREGILVFLPAGSGPSTMAPIQLHEPEGAPPGQFVEVSPSAFQVTDAAGKQVGLGDAVRLTGKLSAHRTSDRVHCSMRAATVQAL
jgi:hypothetical protein